jgi:WD40 repeat protein
VLRFKTVVIGFTVGAVVSCSRVRLLPLALESPPANPKSSLKNESHWLYLDNLFHATAQIEAGTSQSKTPCVSQGGCRIVSPPLPTCGGADFLLPKYVHLSGFLEPADSYVELQNSTDMPNCANTFSAALVLRQSATSYVLNLQCKGDRTGWCCPYPIGTGVQIVGLPGERRGDVVLLENVKICEDSSQIHSSQANAERAAWDLMDYGGNPLVAVWAHANRVAVWPLTRPAPSVLVDADPSPISCVSVNPRADYAFTINQQGRASLWNVATGQPLQTTAHLVPVGPSQRIEPDVNCSHLLLRKVRWSDDGSHLLTVTNEGKASIWNVYNGTRSNLDSNHHTESVHDDIFSFDGRQILLHLEANLLEVRGVDDGRLLAATDGIWGYWLPNGDGILVQDARPGSQLGYHLWQWRDDNIPWEIRDACQGTLSADGRYLSAISPCNSANAIVLNTKTGREVFRAESEYRPVWNNVQFADPKYRDDLAFDFENSLPPSRPLKRLTVAVSPLILALPSRQRLRLWTTDGSIRTFNTTTPPWTRELGFDGRMAWSPDGKILASTHWIWRATTPNKLVNIETHAPNAQILFSEDSRQLLLWDWSMSTHHLGFDAVTLSERRKTDTGELIHRDELHRRAGYRQGVLGIPSPTWTSGDSVLVSAVVGDPGWLQLVRLRDAMQIRLTVNTVGTSVEPVILSSSAQTTKLEPKDLLEFLGARNVEP